MGLQKRETFIMIMAVLIIGYVVVFFRDTDSSSYAVSGVLTTLLQKATDLFTIVMTKLQKVLN
ncbi:hypothetical protein [Paenibacillus sp. O199]|uniref:hypothetical protein n=1 Tax=Paenibacillus sp. O199 TaxID=1643925 RepID=UPI0007BEB329|nr:hypothetical protein [Paenibacillus sp. O199]